MAKYIIGIIILYFGFISVISAQDNMGIYSALSSQIIDSAKRSNLICIGEHSHGDLKAIDTKALILGDVVKNAPTGALLFEAPLVQSVISYIRNKPYSEFVWPFWRYESLEITLDSIIDNNGLICLGFDPQETCNFSRFSSFLISQGFLENDAELTQMDSILSIAISVKIDSLSKNRKLTREEAQLVNENIESIKLKLHWPVGISPTEKALLDLCFDNRKYLATEMTFQNVNEQMNFRDSIMALNVKHIIEILKPKIEQKKVIIWGANLHISKNMSKGDWMIERFIRANSDMVLTIAVVPRKRKTSSKRFDFAVVSGRPEYMSNKLFLNYGCD